MIHLKISDTEAYALSKIIRDFIYENNVEETTKKQLEEKRQALYSYAFNVLTIEDMNNIENLLYKGGE